MIVVLRVMRQRKRGREREREREREKERDRDGRGRGCCLFVCLFVACLLNVPATCNCISGTDMLRQFYALPH